VDPASAILDYARTNHVDHIVLGARTDSALRNLLGSVSGEVVAKAPCTVTVVRPPAEADPTRPREDAARLDAGDDRTRGRGDGAPAVPRHDDREDAPGAQRPDAADAPPPEPS
jgi:universal stress protein family protein